MFFLAIDAWLNRCSGRRKCSVRSHTHSLARTPFVSLLTPEQQLQTAPRSVCVTRTRSPYTTHTLCARYYLRFHHPTSSRIIQPAASSAVPAASAATAAAAATTTTTTTTLDNNNSGQQQQQQQQQQQPQQKPQQHALPSLRNSMCPNCSVLLRPHSPLLGPSSTQSSRSRSRSSSRLLPSAQRQTGLLSSPSVFVVGLLLAVALLANQLVTVAATASSRSSYRPGASPATHRGGWQAGEGEGAAWVSLKATATAGNNAKLGQQVRAGVAVAGDGGSAETSSSHEVPYREARLPRGLGTWLRDDGSASLALQVFYDAVVSQGTDPLEPADLFEVAAWMVGRGRVKFPSDCVVIEMPHAKIHVPLVHHLYRRYMATRRSSIRLLLLAVLRAGARVDFETTDVLRTDRTPIIVQCVESIECDPELLDELLWGLRDARAYRATGHGPRAIENPRNRAYGMSLAHLLPTRSIEVEWVRRLFQLFRELRALDRTRQTNTSVLLPTAVRKLNDRAGQAWLGDAQSFAHAFALSKPLRSLLEDSRGNNGLLPVPPFECTHADRCRRRLLGLRTCFRFG